MPGDAPGAPVLHGCRPGVLPHEANGAKGQCQSDGFTVEDHSAVVTIHELSGERDSSRHDPRLTLKGTLSAVVFDVDELRRLFPALSRSEGGTPVAYLDGPGGTQVPQSVIEAMTSVLRSGVSNLGGPFAASEHAGHIVSEARRAAADLLGADPGEIVFGQNMTSLTFAMSRALGRAWNPGDRVVVTSLDHAANVDPWRAIADARGAEVHQVPFSAESGLLDPDRVTAAIDSHTKLVAVTAASNAIGSVPVLEPIVAAAHEVGAQVYVDAVHHSAHRINAVHDLGVDFLAASAYKFFGPHTGIVYVASHALEDVAPYKVRPAPDRGPGRFETGTQSFESLAGVTAAVDHLASLGQGPTRRDCLLDAFRRIGEHERGLGERFMRGISEMGHIRLHGPGLDRGDRVATFAITVERHRPQEVAAAFGAQGIYVWSGHYYAVDVMRQLGLAESGGAVRIGFVHYTSNQEVDRTLAALDGMS